MSTTLRAAGKQGFLVDPDSAVILPDRGYDDVVFSTIEDALAAAQEWLRVNGSGVTDRRCRVATATRSS